jgi:YebC/PmpR family DNA-binding regulatory protein
MSGHSHWAGIKHKKALTDSKKAGVFTKMARLITVAAREGGGNPDFNFKLKIVVQQARAANMPKDNIERAIKKGTGELKDATIFQETTYEAYGPGQVAMLIKTLTDNKNRALTEVKNILNKNGGKMVAEGAVSFMFFPKGYLNVKAEGKDADEFELSVIEAGAEDIIRQEESFLILVKPENLQKMRENLLISEESIEEVGITQIASQKVKISVEEQEKYEKLVELLEDNEDIQAVYDNLEN